MSLGQPREHHETIGSTNERARELAEEGAAHGTLVTAGEQTAGRGRQGRGWVTPPGVAIAASLVLRDYDDLLPLRAGLAVADVAGPGARVKWPNDVWIEGRKVAGILAEARGQDWAVLGIGVNVALDPATLPPEVAEIAGTLGRDVEQVEPTLVELLSALEQRLTEGRDATLAALRDRDALLGQHVRWQDGEGTGAGIDETGALLVNLPDGSTTALSAGEVTLSTERRESHFVRRRARRRVVRAWIWNSTAAWPSSPVLPRASASPSRAHCSTRARTSSPPPAPRPTSTALLHVAVDLMDPDAPAEVIARAVETYGGLDMLVNNAGGPPPGDRLPHAGFLSRDDAQWTAILEFNLLSAVRACRAALPLLLERGGTIVNVVSVGRRASPRR